MKINSIKKSTRNQDAKPASAAPVAAASSRALVHASSPLESPVGTQDTLEIVSPGSITLILDDGGFGPGVSALERADSKQDKPSSSEQKARRVVQKTGAEEALVSFGALGHVRSAVVENREANFIPNIDAPVGDTLEQELEVFASTFGDRLDGASEQTKYATLIQHIQARFKRGGYSYAFDVESEGVEEYWSTPAEVVADSGKAIDCEDFAFMGKAYGEHIQAELGIGGRFVVHGGLINNDRERGHAILVYHADDGTQYVIDGTHFRTGEGDMSMVQTLAEYTRERNFEWAVLSDGTLLDLRHGSWGKGSTSYNRSSLVPDLDAEGKPVDVAAVEQHGLKIGYALRAKAEMDWEPKGYQGVMAFFGTKREWLGGISLLALGSIVAGPLLIIGDLLKFRSENARVTRDGKMAGTKQAGKAADRRYHQARRNIAGVKGLLDTIRYGAFVVICAGVGALAAPFVALGVGALRCGVGAVDTLHTTAKKFTRFKRRQESVTAMKESVDQCHPEVRALLKSRTSYKLKKTRLSGSRIFGGLKAFAFSGTAAGMIGTAVVAGLAGTLIAVNPVILGVAFGAGILLGVLRGGESLYNGALLRDQKRVFRGGQSHIASRIERIKDQRQGRLSRAGAALNLAGWVTDAVDDRIASWPLAARFAIKTLLAPFYGVTFLTERKSFNEDAMFARLGSEYVRGDVSAAERAALLKTSAAYYGITEGTILLKWMDPTELDELEAYAQTREEPTSPITRRYVRMQEETKGGIDAADLQEILAFRTDVLEVIRLKFAGGSGLTEPSQPKAKPASSKSLEQDVEASAAGI